MPLNEQRPSGWLGRRRTMAAAFGILILAGWGFAGEVMRNKTLQEELDRLDARAMALEAEVGDSTEKVRRLAGPDAAEREARLKLGLMRPGEQVVIIKGSSPPPSAPSVPPPEPELPNWKKWFQYFFKN